MFKECPPFFSSICASIWPPLGVHILLPSLLCAAEIFIIGALLLKPERHRELAREREDGERREDGGVGRCVML